MIPILVGEISEIAKNASCGMVAKSCTGFQIPIGNIIQHGDYHRIIAGIWTRPTGAGFRSRPRMKRFDHDCFHLNQWGNYFFAMTNKLSQLGNSKNCGSYVLCADDSEKLVTRFIVTLTECKHMILMTC